MQLIELAPLNQHKFALAWTWSRIYTSKQCSLLLVIIAAFFLGGCSGTTSYFFYPQSVWFSTPEDVGQSYKNIILTAADGTRLHSWWLPGQQESAHVVVLYLHGNAQNISTHSHSIYWLAQHGIDVLALDYRGFGASQGKAVMPDVLMDIEAATRWIKHHYPDKRLFILGQSIGAALAVNFVAKAEGFYEIDGLIIDAPFESFGAIAREVTSKNMLGWLVYPLTIFIPGKWDPIDQAAEIAIPVLVMHSPDDPVIPYEQGRRVFETVRASGNRNTCWIESYGGHIASFNHELIRNMTLAFLKQGDCTAITAN